MQYDIIMYMNDADNDGVRWLYRMLQYRRLGRCVRAKSTRPEEEK